MAPQLTRSLRISAAETPPAGTASVQKSTPTTVAAVSALVFAGIVLTVKGIMVYSTAKDVVSTSRQAVTWAKKRKGTKP